MGLVKLTGKGEKWCFLDSNSSHILANNDHPLILQDVLCILLPDT